MTAFATRPVVRGRTAAVTSGHYLATAAGMRIFNQGGNAFDAAAATAFCLVVLEPNQNGLGGEVPILLYSAADQRAFAISGMGWSPRRMTIDWFREQQLDLIPGDGYLPACVPAMVGTWALVLERFGTMRLAQVLAPAIELAEDGFPMYENLSRAIELHAERMRSEWPKSAAIYLPDGRVPEPGELFRNADLAGVLRRLCEAESSAGGSRSDGLRAARDAFYTGTIARQIVTYIAQHPVKDASGRRHAGLMELDDLAEWRPQVEQPVTLDWRGMTVCKCPGWTQGPVFLQQLALLEGFDLRAMGQNSPQYLHTLLECAKLAFADREAWYGDPAFDQSPLEELLSTSYNRQRRMLVGEQASRELRPGATRLGSPDYVGFDVAEDNRRALGLGAAAVGAPAASGDTTHLDACDAAGNMISATPSGGWFHTSPVIEGLGFPLGTRGQMFYLNPRRPNALQPRKRPRATLTPTIVLRDGRPFMAFGTEGGDAQDQWSLQFFLNHIVFGMDLQSAADAPTFTCQHFPSSFHPRQGFAARVAVEETLSEVVREALAARGHEIVLSPGWTHGKVMAVQFDHARKTISAAATAKNGISYALAW